MTTTVKKPASELTEGDFLVSPNLYVVEVEHDLECSAFTGRYNALLGTFTVVTGHDEQGEENYLLLNPDVMVEVKA